VSTTRSIDRSESSTSTGDSAPRFPLRLAQATAGANVFAEFQILTLRHVVSRPPKEKASRTADHVGAAPGLLPTRRANRRRRERDSFKDRNFQAVPNALPLLHRASGLTPRTKRGSASAPVAWGVATVTAATEARRVDWTAVLQAPASGLQNSSAPAIIRRSFPPQLLGFHPEMGWTSVS
jgi:hypothetical protein